MRHATARASTVARIMRHLFALATFASAATVANVTAPQGYDLHQSTGFWLHRLYTAMHRRFAAELEPQGITPEHWQVLVGVFQAGARTPQELAAYTGTDASTITRRVDQLEERGLLRRTPNPCDRRSIYLELTDEGRTLSPRIATIARKLNQDAMAHMSDAERRAFQQTLRRMMRNLGEPLPDGFQHED
jgi:DNA-binding MarR family transcriptional regulator